MTARRIPGPLCSTTSSPIDAGTLCRSTSYPPGPIEVCDGGLDYSFHQVDDGLEIVLTPIQLSHPQEVLELKIKAVLRAKVVEDFFNVGL